jgi:hypothetical protein
MFVLLPSLVTTGAAGAWDRADHGDKSERLSLPSPTIEAAAHIRADDDFAVAFNDVVPSAVPVKARLLNRRSGARSLFHGRRVYRYGACALTAGDTDGADKA